MRRWYKLGENGVTLLELMLVLVTMAIVVAAIPMTFRSGTSVWEKGDSHAEAMQNGLIAIEDMSREIRQTKSLMEISDPDDDTGYIQFKYRDYKDENEDGDTTDYKYQRYELSAAGEMVTHNTEYDVAKPDPPPSLLPGSEMAGPAESLRFVGYYASGSPVPAEALPEALEKNQIRSVRIHLITSDSKDKVSDIPLSAQVYLGYFPDKGKAEDFAVFGHVSVEIKEKTDIGDENPPSNIGSNGPVSIGNNTYIDGKVVTYNPDFKDGVTFGPSYEPDAYPIEMPCCRDFGGYALGGKDVKTGPNETVPDDVFPLGEPENIDGYLTPFEEDSWICYGDFDLSNDNDLYLRSGTYFFESFSAQQELTLHIKLDGGAIDHGEPYIWIFVDGQVIIGNMLGGLYLNFEDVEIEDPNIIAKHIYMEIHHEQKDWGEGGFKKDAACLFGQNVTFYGTVYAPYGNISISDGTFYGSLYTGGSIYVEGGMVPGEDLTSINFVKSYYATYYWTYPSDWDEGICPDIDIHPEPPI